MLKKLHLIYFVAITIFLIGIPQQSIAQDEIKDAAFEAVIENDSASLESLLDEIENPDSLIYENHETLLMLASRLGNIEVMSLLLSEEADPNLTNNDGNHALILATLGNQPEAVQLLIDEGANLELKNHTLATALWLAADIELGEAVDILIEAGADLEAKNENGYTPLMRVSAPAAPDVAEALINAGADVNGSDNMRRNMIFHGASNNNLTYTEFWLEHGTNPDIEDLDGWSPLARAISRDYVEITQLLLDNGADPNGRSSDRQCALSFASAAGHLDIVRELISLGANPDIYNINGVTAIMRVKEGRSIEILEALIDAGTQIDFRDNLNRTALWHTVHNGWADGGRILLSAGADPDMAEDTSSGGLSPRKIAYERGQTGMSIVFVAHDNGVDVLTEKSKEEYLAETIDATGLTATELLHQPFADCVRMNNLDAVRFYLEVDVNPSQIYLNREANLLCLAAQEGHLDMVHELLEAGVDPNETDDEGWPPIFYAIEHWQAGTAQALIDGGYDVNYALEVPRIEEGWYDTNFWEYDWGMTALHLACKKPNGDIMRALIRAGADVNVFDWDDRTPLVYCSDAGSFDMVRDLVEAGADIDLEASWALLTAVRYEHAPIVRYLLEQGANPNIESTTRGNPLIVMAAMDGNSEIVNILIEFNTELDLSGRHGITALMYAAGRGYIDMVRALLDNGADYSLHSQDGATALAYARGHDQEEIINLLSEYMEQPIESGDHAPWSPVMDYTFADQILYNTEFNLDEWLDMGIDPDAVDDEGLPAIMVATIENKIELVQGLLDAGADPNATSPDGSTALMYAAAFDYPEIARILLDSGSNPNMVRDGDDSNALYLACDSGAVDIVRMLIDAGVIIDFVIGDQSDMDLTSPIYRASRNNYREIVVMLLEAGADPDAGFRQYRSPLINACGRGDAEMFELLIEAGADVNRHDHNGITPLIIASKFNFPVLVSRLIELGADVHVASDEYYQTALTAAAARNNTQVMGMLLDAGAGIEALDYENWTPLMFAISWGQEDAVRLLIDRGANVHAKDIYGRSTIDIANNAARWNIAQILRDASAS